MEKYEYKVVSIKNNAWSGYAEDDYLQIINEYGAQGWRFREFVSGFAKPKGAPKGFEVLLERKIIETL